MKGQKTSVKATGTVATRSKLMLAFVKGVSFLALVLGLVLTSVASAADPNLVGWWKLDEGEGQTAYDSAGSNDGTIYGATWTTGKLGGALDFDGDGDCVEIGNIKDSMSTTELSVSIWTKRVGLSSTSQEPFFTKGSYYESSSAFFMGRTNTGTRINFSIKQCYAWTADVLPDNEWVHFVISYKKGSWGKVYRNGVFLANLSAHDVDIPLDSYIVRIGEDESSNHFNGITDAVRIYNRALSAAEIQALMLGNELLLPGFRAPLLNEPATPSDFRSKLGQGSSGQGPSTSDPEIQELARALKYDPGLMYKFVHDYIQYYNTWGEVKGPYMTWMDRSGNGFDQASLMIALLEEAEQHSSESEYTVADPHYVVGEIQLSVAQASEWLDIPDDPNVAREVLARAGLYGIVNEDGEGYISSIELEHVWVKVEIDGNDYEFDPSFKIHTKKNGLSSSQLEQAMGYNQSTFISNAMQGYEQGDPGIRDINDVNIEDDLTTYSTNLINYIKNNQPNGGLADIIGGRGITAADDSALPPTSLPYTVLSRDDEFAIEDMPNLYRTSLRILHCGIDQTFWSSEIYGRRLTLTYNESNQPQLFLDGNDIATGNATTPGQIYYLTLSVDHPYDVNDFDGTTTLKVTAGGFYQIVNGWGDTGTKILEKHRGLLEQYRFDNLADDSEKVLGESFALVGLTWLAQTSRMRSMASEANNNENNDYRMLINHHMLGVTGQYESPYIDMPAGQLGIVSFDDFWNDDEEPNGIFLTIAGHASAYEHEVIRQLQDCNSVSTVKLLEMANDRTSYDRIFYTSSSNWSSIQSLLQDYSQDEKDQVSTYVNADFGVNLPEYGDLGEDDWTGMGFQARLSTADCLTASYIISGGFNGGCGTDENAPLSPSQLFDRSFVPNPGNSDAGVGACSFGSTDLTIGNGGLPFGLSFSRQYSSERRLEDGPLGLGWTHNFDITAKVTSESFQALGEDSPIDAAAHIVSLYITCDILTDHSGLTSRNIIASLCETWLMDQMAVNLVTFKQGSASMEFVKVPDCNDPNGMYSAPPGTNLKLIVEDDDTFLLKNGSGIFYDFDSQGRISRWSDAHGNVVDFIYTNGRLTDVESNIGDSSVSRSLTLHYDVDDHIEYVTDSASRSIYYDYDANDNLIEYTNPDGNDYTYEYDDVNDGRLTKIFSPVNLVIENVYDSLGRIKQQADANDNTYDYYHAYYRSERLEPEQTDPNDDTARFSTITWYNEHRRPIRTIDQLGRESTYGYDGLLRLTTSVSPSGTSAKYEYDENNHIIDANSICKPGSPHVDPNTTIGNDYDSYENSDGRWFTARKKHTDPNACEVVYEYDYDDIGTYGTDVGNLMKITYPQVDPPYDTNTPIVEFTYDPNGQLETMTDPNGMVTKFKYYTAAEGAGLKKTIVDYGGTGHLNITSELTYDSVGRVETIKDPLGNITENQYYPSGLLKKTVSPDPNYEMTYEYYADGKLKHVKQQTSEEGLIYLQSIMYTITGQKESVRGPYADGNDLDINLTQYTYDNLGRLWKVKDAENNVTEIRYYPNGKVWKVIDALGNAIVTKTYNPDGSLQKVEDAEGNVTQYEYNGFMGLKKTIYPDGTYTEPGYNMIRGLETMKTRAGQTISVLYDDLRRVKRKVLPDNTIYYKYDLTGKVLEITDNTGTIKNTYDSAGRPIKIEYADGKVVSYEYNLAGNRTKLTYPDNSYITYEYDQLNRLTKIRDQASTILASYTYDSRSRRTNLSYANGTNIGYQYDTASRLLSINNQTGPGPVQYKYAYTYDNVGNRLKMVFNDADEHLYSYDNIYQVTDVNYPASYEYLDTELSYDKASNRTAVIDDGTTNYASNELNQYNSIGDNWYDYDKNGNLTYDTSFFYSYDAENHLTTAFKATGGGTGPLTAALDTYLDFTTGGDANWVRTTLDYCGKSNRDSALSGEVSTGQTSWLETTVESEGTFMFCHKLSFGASGTYKFSVDGDNLMIMTDDSKSYLGSKNAQLVSETSIGSGWWQYTYLIKGLGPHTIRWSYSAEGSARVDYVQWTSTNEVSPSLQRALDVGWPIVTAGDKDWSSTGSGSYHDGDCAKSGIISHDEVSQMQATVEGEGTVTFYWKVDSEPDCDYLQFYIDGVLKHEISGEVSWQQKSYNLTGSSSHSLLWQYVKDGSISEGYDCGWVDWLQGPGSAPPPPPPPNPFGEVLDCDLSFTDGGDGYWYKLTSEGYYDNDCAQSSSIDDDEESWLQTTVDVNVQETVKFYWKVSSELDCDYLQFYIDSALKDEISGEVDWQQKSYTVSGAGSHTLKWVYIKDYGEYEGEDCGWVDYVQWTGQTPPPSVYPDVTKWKTTTYKYDPSGRRIEKAGNDEAIRYVYDGGNVIAEYNGNGGLLCKYIYGPCVDEPVCMINVADSNAVSYYHFDGLGSVVALSDSYGNSIQSYEYSIYGQVAASDPNHPNPYMFTGRRFDFETGLYYYRARYYNPYIGRFLQTDPVGYGAGINWYAYCGNNPMNWVDPSGLIAIAFYDPTYENYYPDKYIDSPEEMKEWADDFGFIVLKDETNIARYGSYIDLYQPMNSSGDVLDTLEWLTEVLEREGEEITAVYFYDHAGYIDFHVMKLYCFWFGDEEVWVIGRESFWKKLGEAVPETCSLNFRGCYLGGAVESLAKLTGRTVTGVDGMLKRSVPFPKLLGPDYVFKGDLMVGWDAGYGIGITIAVIWEQYVIDPDGNLISNPEPNPY